GRDIRSTVMAFSRNAFAGSARQALSPGLQAGLADLYAGYQFDEHSQPGATGNAMLLARPGMREVERVLFDRFAIATVPELAAERLIEIQEMTGIDKFFLCIESSDPVGLARLAASRMLPRLPLSG
ncbi:MAG TPA: hypothetical protein VN719_11800, partial [Gemmatimonadales bacterium]|nr:hypothetical protein [Gemmatimonadales bacterium]